MNIDILKAFKAYMGAGEYCNAYDTISYGYKDDRRVGHDKLIQLRGALQQAIAKKDPDADIYYELLRMSYLMAAKDYLDDYAIAVEWNRPAKEKFYLPRRKGLLPMVEEMQKLADDELDLLGISAPPGVGKTGIACFFLCFLAGRNPEQGMLIGSHNGAFLRGLYEECLRELDPEGEYAWNEIFKGHSVARTNALDMRLDVDKPSRFSTFQFSSVGSGNAGKVRAVQLLYCDDLIEGIEEAMNRERLDKKWTLYTTDLKQRKQGKCKELHIATRWSVWDVLGRLEEEHEGDPRAKFIKMRALNEKGESNFDYGGTSGFTTKFYLDMKKTMDEASFRALYMSEPIEREGLLYEESNIKRYVNLPAGEADAILAACDTAAGGGDYTVMAIFAKYGEEHYMIDCVCTSALPDVSDPMLAHALFRNGVRVCQFESNSAGARTADKVEELTRRLCSGTTVKPATIKRKHTQSDKLTKIIVNSAWVKEHCHFLDDRKINRGTQYETFMKQMLTFTLEGKNKHDDVPDCLAQYALFTENFLAGTVTVLKRPF